jgi:hypothetical protein
MIMVFSTLTKRKSLNRHIILSELIIRRKLRIAKEYWNHYSTFIESSLGTGKGINASQFQPWRQGIRIALLTADIELDDSRSKGKEHTERVHWKDWVNDDSTIDFRDHSTTAVDLALLYGPQAEVYIARVPEPSVEQDQDTSTICEVCQSRATLNPSMKLS